MNFIIRNTCAVCKNTINQIYDISNIPISLSCCSTLQTFTYETLSFGQCIECNTIQLNKLVPLNILYDKSHNYISFGKTWDGYFSLLIEKINHIAYEKTILEIGCPSGKLANKCKDYKKWYIVEPNKNESIQFNEKTFFIETFFDSDFETNDTVDIIVHSHVFEHIYSPNDFLKKCYDVLPDDGQMIFGVPNMEYMASNNINLFVGVFFEHTIFLNKENITFLLEQNGFSILEIIDYENHSTIYHVKKHIKKRKDTLQIYNYYNNFMIGIDNYKSFIDKCNLKISNTQKDVYIFGASYNTQFILSMGLNTKCIKGVLDNCPDKQNKYFYGFDLLIYNPTIIINNDCIIILKMGYYVNEIIEQIMKMNPTTEFLI